MNTQIEYIWFHIMLQLLVVACIAGLIGGSALILRPALLTQLGKRANQWVSLRTVNGSLENWVSLDKWFYQYHQVTGGLMLAGAAWVIGYFALAFDRHGTAGLFFMDSNFFSPVAVEIMLDVFILVCVGGAAFAMLIGGILLARPVILRDLEQRANKWLSLRKALKPVEIPRSGMDEFVIQHARPAGMLILLGSLYILAVLLFAIR